MPRYFPDIRKELITARNWLDKLQRNVGALSIGIATKEGIGESASKLKDELIENLSTQSSVKRDIEKLEVELLGNWTSADAN
jgi:hypothetical protein